VNISNLRQIVRSTRGLWHYHLKNAALNTGLLAGHRDYTRFIILGRSRTGSNLLRSLLNSHPQVVAFNELYRARERISWGLPYYPQSSRLLTLRQRDPVGFLESEVYGTYPRSVAAVGFKIFYYHAQDDDWKILWDHLLAQRDLRVIHIKRDNMLRTHLSRKRAQITNSWENRSGRQERNPAVTLDYAECLHDFETTRGWEQRFDELFHDHPRCVVHYEQLAADYVAQSARIMEFLGVPPLPVEPLTRKQSRAPLSAQIINYADMKRQFAGTPWADYFDE